jgi:hypothetical protein
MAAGVPTLLFQTMIALPTSLSRPGHGDLFSFDVSSDGQRFIMPARTSADSRPPGTYPIVVVQNSLDPSQSK